DTLRGGIGTMKSCPHCSVSLEEDTVRCPRCGKWAIENLEGKRGKRKKGGGGRSRLFLLGALLLFAWVLWKIPESTIIPRERLNLKPPLSATLEAMESDLEGLIALQAEYFRSHGSFSGSPSVLGFRPSEGVNVSLIATPDGWSAAATHEEYPREVGCAVYGGSGIPPSSPVSPTEAGVVECVGRTR
ncbi:MAG: hypothetical protein MUO50_02145, partial [Longimicrobiales bacterium]|nr:hypothetical protein [Longimicrobiales bacterium]